MSPLLFSAYIDFSSNVFHFLTTCFVWESFVVFVLTASHPLFRAPATAGAPGPSPKDLFAFPTSGEQEAFARVPGFLLSCFPNHVLFFAYLHRQASSLFSFTEASE